MLAQDDRPISRFWLAFLLVAALALRLGWGFVLPAEEETLKGLPDQAGYLEMAQNLVRGQGLMWVDRRFDDQTYAVRMPLYPLLVAACGASVRALRVVQAFIDTSTVLAIYLLARRWLGARPSIFAAAIVAVDPFLIYFSGLVLTETLFTAMLSWSLALLVTRQSFLWGGLVLSMSVLLRPSALLLPVTAGIASALANRPRPASTSRGWPLPVGTTMLLLALLAMLPWVIRNRTVLGRWIWTTTNGGFVAYDGFNDDATGGSDQSALSSLEWNSRLRRLSEVQRNDLLQEEAWQWIENTWRERPRRLFELTAAKIARTWSPVPLSAEFGSRRMYKAAAMVYTIPFALLIVVGLWKGIVPRAGKVFLVLPAVYITLVHAMSIGSLRYRVPVEPAMAVLASAGALAVLSSLRLPIWRRSDPVPRSTAP